MWADPTLLSQLVGGRTGSYGLLSFGPWGWASHTALLCGCSHVGTREAWRVYILHKMPYVC